MSNQGKTFGEWLVKAGQAAQVAERAVAELGIATDMLRLIARQEGYSTEAKNFDKAYDLVVQGQPSQARAVIDREARIILHPADKQTFRQLLEARHHWQ